MKIKIGKFNFVSKEKKEFELSSYSVQSKFDYFYFHRIIPPMFRFLPFLGIYHLNNYL